MEAASCSANNALNKFTAHANVDSSLTHQLRQNGQQVQSGNNFSSFNKLSSIDRNLEQEFQHFGTPQFADSTLLREQQLNTHQPHQFRQPQHQPQQQWLNDFQQLNINGQQSTTSPALQQSVQSNKWASEFSQSSQVQYNMETQDSFYRQSRTAIQPQFNMGYQTMNRTTMAPQVNSVEPDFDAAFNEMEDQLSSANMNADPVEEQKMQEKQRQEEEDKIKFAKLAQSVFMTMSNTPQDVSEKTSSKFKNSNFLKLMNKISTREVEMNDKQNKFIDASGNDIRDMLPDPLRDIKDGELSGMSAFESAKVVHERVDGHLRPSSWEMEL